jgi:hypothetical protein
VKNSSGNTIGYYEGVRGVHAALYFFFFFYWRIFLPPMFKKLCKNIKI